MDDVFGAMLSAAFEDRSVREIVDREDGFINRLPASRYIEPLSASNGAVLYPCHSGASIHNPGTTPGRVNE